jgi:hypothetical protein
MGHRLPRHGAAALALFRLHAAPQRAGLTTASPRRWGSLAQVGTPERPLSDLGLVSYRGYWTRQLMPLLMQREGTISIRELSEATRIRPDDIINTLNHLELIQYQKVGATGRRGGERRALGA